MLDTLFKTIWVLMIAVMMTGCASLRKAELASNDPQQVIAEVTQTMMAAQDDQIDLLADEQYNQGSSFLSNAKRGLKQGDLPDTIISNAAVAKAFFQDARKTAAARQVTDERILTARKFALNAGVRKSDPLVAMMKEIDDDLKYETKKFSKMLSPEEFAELQKRYLLLEAKAVQFSKLNEAKKVIDKARSDDADDLAPEALRSASLDYNTAMNIIAQSPRSPDIYNKSVQDANISATLLRDVMDVILGAKGTPEHIALQIVKQKRALGELSTSVGKLQENLETTKKTLQKKEGELQRTEGVLKSQEEQLARASMQVRFQQAMDQARKVLSSDDALVYQQGNKLVFRLKRINFKSGMAVIPESSKPLLTQVNNIIKTLDAEKVIVEGHTDSVGSAEVNKKLSQKRASAVANYLYSLKGGYTLSYAGYGEAYPIVSNETKQGRATNRRVDLVVSVKQ